VSVDYSDAADLPTTQPQGDRMSDSGHTDDIRELHREVRLLNQRVEDLEGLVAMLTGAEPSAEAAAAPPPPSVWTEPTVWSQPPSPKAEPLPPPATAAPTPTPQPPRPMRPAPPPRPPIDWGKVAEQAFTARTLAWAGGVATALGIVLLFVMAASRGWVTPEMRVGLGLIVSLGLLGAAVELDRRAWRADAILAAAGVGIAGLYATLWASTSLYEFFGAGIASPLAAAIAALAVAVAIRIREERLAVFGLSAAMIAPIPISADVTGGGVLFSSLMLAAALPLFHVLRWRWVVAATAAIGFAEAVALLLVSAGHTGFTVALLGTIVVALLLMATAFLLELSPSRRDAIGWLGGLAVPASFTLSTGVAFLFAGDRHLDGHSIAAVWAVFAALPYAIRRAHANLTDLIASFALAAAATATGLLLGGPAQVCAWAAEAALLVLAAERIAGRSHTRQIRLTLASGAYLVLAVAGALTVVWPSSEHLREIGAGSWDGTIALAAIALAGIAYCFGTRWVPRPERVLLWLVPALAIGYLPVWALPAESAVVAYAAIAAVLFAYRRSKLMISWLHDDMALLIAAGWWIAGAEVALAVTSPVEDLFVSDWSGFGARDGMIGIAALLASACVMAWSIRRPRRQLVEHGLLVPVAVLAYLLAEALEMPYATWSWLVLAGVLAAVVQVPVVRRVLTPWPLIAGSAALIGLGVGTAWGYDESLDAIADHARTAGWESIAIATASSLLLALAFLDPRRRSYALWLPFALAAQLSAMLLPGQYPVVVIAGMSCLASIVALEWPRWLRDRLDRAAMVSMGVLSALGVAGVVVVVYETPRMLFQTSHAPASGLAAAVAATAALFLAAAAARTSASIREIRFGRMRASTILVYLAGAAGLWTLAAAVLGVTQLLANPDSDSSVRDGFQQGHMVVSISWVVVGLMLVVLSLRGDRRALRVGGIALLFVALGKLFIYDLAFLTAMTRAISFIVTGSVLLLAALLLQRFAPQVKAALGDDPPNLPAH
jgi:uncharacterized membrane protein